MLCAINKAHEKHEAAWDDFFLKEQISFVCAILQ